MTALTASMTDQGLPVASDWVQRWTHLARAHGTVLDVACGQGRHMQWFAAHGFVVTGVDFAAQALAVASQHGTTLKADLENAPWPLTHGGLLQQFDVVLVTNYLWRALMPNIVQSVAPGGLLIYETFASGNEQVGKPARADFLLQPGELLQACQSMHVVAYENGFLPQPARFVQRIAAIQPPCGVSETPHSKRYPLSLK
jgi:2-polyprenyl-3-methyl-5-hydroxy-6-metoxy-1,4-benzoquinol methylase